MRLYKQIRFSSAICFCSEDISDNLKAAALDILNTGEDSNQAKMIKRNSARQLFTVAVDGQTYFVKTYHPEGVWHACKGLMRTPEGVRVLNHALILGRKGIPAVRMPMAMVERDAFCNPKSLVASCRHQGTSLKQFLVQEASVEVRQNVLSDFARLFGDLLESNFYHGDPNLENFLVDRGKVILIDLDSLKRFPHLPRLSILANLVRLNRVLLGQSKLNFKTNLARKECEFVVAEVLKRFFASKELDSALRTVKQSTRR